MAQRIMVVDDDEDVRDLVCRMLSDAGFAPVAASGGRQALDLALSCPPDLIITDVVMPEVDGLELLQSLRRSLPGMRAVVMSGGGRIPPDSTLAAARRLGARAVLRKPFSKAEFLDALKSALNPSESQPPQQGAPHAV